MLRHLANRTSVAKFLFVNLVSPSNSNWVGKDSWHLILVLIALAITILDILWVYMYVSICQRVDMGVKMGPCPWSRVKGVNRITSGVHKRVWFILLEQGACLLISSYSYYDYLKTLTLSPLNPKKPSLPAHPCKNNIELNYFKHM